MARCTDCMEGQGRGCKCRKPISDRVWLMLLAAWTVVCLSLSGYALWRAFT